MSGSCPGGSAGRSGLLCSDSAWSGLRAGERARGLVEHPARTCQPVGAGGAARRASGPLIGPKGRIVVGTGGSGDAGGWFSPQCAYGYAYALEARGITRVQWRRVLMALGPGQVSWRAARSAPGSALLRPTSSRIVGAPGGTSARRRTAPLTGEYGGSGRVLLVGDAGVSTIAAWSRARKLAVR